MCGITGIYSYKSTKPINEIELKKMTKSLIHRGPDEFGYYIKKNIGMGHSRLSIIDLTTGQQPIFNENKSIAVVLNGEIYNYIELRKDLIERGHLFYTTSDTEVIVHLYEEFGIDFLSYLNGQFAIALWDSKLKELILARDRVGIRPLFYSITKSGSFIFASEMKALLKHSEIDPKIDPLGIEQTFTIWANLPPRTVFAGIKELAAGPHIKIKKNRLSKHRYWELSFPFEGEYENRPFSYYKDRVRELVEDSVKLRLRADVPVATYLSGGLDSSIITALVKKNHNNDLKTFSVSFKEKNFDESIYQEQMVDFLKTEHRKVTVSSDDIKSILPDIIRYSEKPLIRSAPAPLFALSKLVRQNNIKVVLTGEGADEIFGGYNIFKEDKIRRFWAQSPDSKIRPQLLTKLYNYVTDDKRAQQFWISFFKKDLLNTESPIYSHKIRWDNTSKIKRFLNTDFAKDFDQMKLYEEIGNSLPKDILKWHPLCRAQYLEISIFMSGYLLSSQGDRMMMGNSVEGRFPFLDHRIIEFAATIPPKYKIKLLNEKYILKESFKDLLPEKIVNREKQPYRAPITACFTNKGDDYLSTLLSKEKLTNFGYFKPEPIEKLLNKSRLGKSLTATEDMSLMGTASLQMLHNIFIEKK